MSLQKEDVYETEDPLPSEAIETEEQFDDQDIEKIHVDIDGALKLFGNRLLNADDVDFSDPLFRKQRGYRSGNYVLELVGTDRRAEETPDQKFARLKSEIQELSETVKERKSANDESIVFSKEELNGLNDLLKAAFLQKSNAGGDVSSKREIAGAGAALYKSEAESSTRDLIKLKNIDERIQRIEEAISIGRHFHNKSEPLAETLENLKIQVDSLNPVYLEGVQEYLNTVIKKLGEVEKQRKKTQPDDLEEKISKLYKMVTEWDTTCTNVPTIVKRLHALSKLHEQAQNFSLKLNDLSLIKEHLEKKTENQKVILFEVKRDSSKIIAELSEKVKALDKRIDQLK